MPNVLSFARPYRYLLLWLVLMAGLGAASAGAADATLVQPAATARTPHVEISLVAEDAVAQAAGPTWLGLHFRLRPGWHIYWRNPGDSGYPPSFTWKLPAGARAGEIAWPTPARLPFGPLTNFGYKDEVMLSVPLVLSGDARSGPLPVRVDAHWLVCEEVCIPESASLGRDLALAESARPDPAAAALFAAARQRWPAAAPPADWELRAESESGGVALHLRLPGSPPSGLQFFPFAEGLMQPSAEQNLQRDGDGYRLRLSNAEVPLAPWQRLHGVLAPAGHGSGSERAEVGAERTARAFVIDLPVEVASGAAPVSLLAAMLLALVGGVLLNLMPCVLPVLSIKLLALLKPDTPASAERTRDARSHALLYSLGVVGSFLLLAALLIGLKAAGHALGWGFQLQSPTLVSALALLFFALGLSLSGALPIATLAQDVPGAWRLRHPRLDAVASGGLAVLVASPCTAPFMGAALGAAFALPPAQTLLVFAALGGGMALPVALLVRYPAWLRWLPRPGAWMERLRQLLALPLYATVVWLAWVLVEQIGPDAIVPLGAGLVAVAALAWCLHLRDEHWRRAGALVCVIAVITCAIAPAGKPSGAAPGGTEGKLADAPADPRANERWQPWSPEALAAARALPAPVFVDFTAAWCVTCQVNKRLVLTREDVAADFAAAGVVLLRADWTRHDPRISTELGRLGRSGVPVYALYPPHGAPLLLPEILSRGNIQDALRRIGSAVPAPS